MSQMLFDQKSSQDSRGQKLLILCFAIRVVGYDHSTMSSILESVWNSAQPKLTEIRVSLAKGKRENPHIIRVGQLDSELLDQELAQLLKEPINKALSLISVCLSPNLANFKRLTHQYQYTKSRV